MHLQYMKQSNFYKIKYSSILFKQYGQLLKCMEPVKQKNNFTSSIHRSKISQKHMVEKDDLQ